jgi:hypothetical protein
VRAIGLDVHLEFCEVAISEQGKVRSAGRIETKPEAIELFARSLGADDRVALERRATPTPLRTTRPRHVLPDAPGRVSSSGELGWNAPVVLRSAFSPTIRGRDAELGVFAAARSCALGFGCGSADRGRGWYGEEPSDRRGPEDGAPPLLPGRYRRGCLRSPWPSLRRCSGRSSTAQSRCLIAPG